MPHTTSEAEPTDGIVVTGASATTPTEPAIDALLRQDGILFGGPLHSGDELVDSSGLYREDQDHVASWLHLSLGLETG